MTVRERLVTRLAQPQSFARVKHSDRVLCLVNYGISTRNLATDTAGTPAYFGGLTSSVSGISLQGEMSTVASDHWIYPVENIAGTAPFCIVFPFDVTATDSTARGLFSIASGVSSGTPRIFLRRKGDGAAEVFANGGYRITSAAGLLVSGQSYVAVIQYDGGVLSLWITSQLIGTYAASTLGTNSAANFIVGNSFGGNAGANYPMAFYALGALDDPQGVSGNPWKLFEPQHTFVPVSVGSSGIPVLSLPGVQSITATSAVPKVTVTFS